VPKLEIITRSARQGVPPELHISASSVLISCTLPLLTPLRFLLRAGCLTNPVCISHLCIACLTSAPVTGSL